MYTSRQLVSAALMIALTITTASAGLSVWAAQQRSYRVSEQQVDQLLRRIEMRSTECQTSRFESLGAVGTSDVDASREREEARR